MSEKNRHGSPTGRAVRRRGLYGQTGPNASVGGEKRAEFASPAIRQIRMELQEEFASARLAPAQFRAIKME